MGYVSSMAGQLADAFGAPVLSASVAPMDYDTVTYKSAALAASGGVTYNLYVDGLSVSTDGDMAEAVQEFARQLRRAASS